MLPELHLGDTVKLRKPHPCGSYEWKIVRLGADIGIECLTCGRRVIIPRRQLARRLKTILTSQTATSLPEMPPFAVQPSFPRRENPEGLETALSSDELDSD